uniref:Uncharacterized protein n=1 Tax=Plectus sambesii TaxID=2011161 RepID=A0A914UV09_9BILA
MRLKTTFRLQNVRERGVRLRQLATETFLVKSDDDCELCQKKTVCVTHRTFALVSKEQLDEPMWLNPYVHCGYRPTQLPPVLCLKSSLQWNNETVNIWSHVIGLLYFTWCQLYDNAVSLPQMGAKWEDHVVFTGSALCSQICMFMSACYHIFGCTSPIARQWWLTMDVMGISAGLMGIYFSGIYYAFYCFPTCLTFYMSLFILLLLITLLAPMHCDYLTPKFFNKRMGYYHFVYAAVVLYGIIPTIHWIGLEGGLDSTLVSRFLPNVLTVYGLTGVAFAFYALMVPERWRPGYFDIVGWSHQWWHLLI